MLLALSWLALATSCGHCPKPIQPAPVVEIVKPPACNLPALPPTVPIAVGFPTPDQVFLSKSDFAAMLAYVGGLKDWIQAADGCLSSRGQ